MDINTINQVNNLNNISSVNAQNVQGARNIVSTDKEASNVAIKDMAQGDKNTLSRTLETLNEGIATSKIAQDALYKQREVLTTLSDKLDTKQSNTLTQDEENEVKKEIVMALQNFNEIAQNTKFNSNALLNKEDNYLNIATSTSSFSTLLPNTTQISDTLITSFRQTDLMNPSSVQNFSNALKEASTGINNTAKELQSVEKSLHNVAKDSIKEQLEALSSKAAASSINFGQEVLDFSKNNITSQLGFLVSTQANTFQAQSVRLLS